MRTITRMCSVMFMALAIILITSDSSRAIWGIDKPEKPAVEKPDKQTPDKQPTKEPAKQTNQCTPPPCENPKPKVDVNDPCLTKPCMAPRDNTPAPKTLPEPPHSPNPIWERNHLEHEIDVIKETNGLWQPILNPGPSNVPVRDWSKPVRPVRIQPGRVPQPQQRTFLDPTDRKVVGSLIDASRYTVKKEPGKMMIDWREKRSDDRFIEVNDSDAPDRSTDTF